MSTSPSVFGEGATLDQIGVVVEDIDAFASSMRRLFGIEPRIRSRNTYEGSLYRGEVVTAEVDTLFYDFFGIELEVHCPRNATNVWHEHLQRSGPGLHHIRVNLASNEQAVMHFTELSIDPAAQGDSMLGNGIKYTYWDTVPELGFFVETFNNLIRRPADSLRTETAERE